MTPTLWKDPLDRLGVGGEDYALMTFSNSVTVLSDYIRGNENFSGPLTVTVAPPQGGFWTSGWLTYYFTEDFAALPGVGATVVPSGTSLITIEKSKDLLHWGTVFFKPVESDQTGFYRFSFSK
jgi:hypothetical protein